MIGQVGPTAAQEAVSRRHSCQIGEEEAVVTTGDNVSVVMLQIHAATLGSHGRWESDLRAAQLCSKQVANWPIPQLMLILH